MYLLGCNFPGAVNLLAFKPACAEFKVADALAISGKAISVPSLVIPVELFVAFFAIALGSNLPAYGTGEASPLGVVGERGDAATGDAIAGGENAGELAAFLSISSSRFRVLPAP